MQDRFERFVVSITELHRYLQKLKELEMGQLDLKAGYTMCLYHLGKHPEGLTATQLTELCKEDKAAISRTLSQLSAKGLVSCELPENKRQHRRAEPDDRYDSECYRADRSYLRANGSDC